MKKLIIPLVITLLLLCSCGVDENAITPVAAGFSSAEYSAYDFTLRIELEKQTCVLLATGDLVITDNPKTVTGEIEEALFGDNIGAMQVLWQDGVMTSDGVTEEMSWEELRASLIYAPPLVFDGAEIKSATIGNVREGTKYRHQIKDNVNNELFYSLLGEALPEICGVASVVESETEFKNIVCEYILDGEGKPVSYSVSFSCTYQDTPPYIPGVKPNKDKYTTQIDVQFRASYN